jgi:hypothetical protein
VSETMTKYPIRVETDLVVVTCYLCDVPFAMPERLKRQRKQDKRSFWCPNGHEQHYTRNEADDLKDQLAAKEQAIAEWREEYAREKAQHSATKGKLTRLTKNGVCPLCRRNFSALARHMKTKHSEDA